MSRWLSLRGRSSSAGADGGRNSSVYQSVKAGLQELYKTVLLPLEQDFRFHQFYSPLLTDGDFAAKPMIMLIGQYSTGKTTFIQHLLEKDYPGLRIGPEPTTDRFVAVMENETEQIVPGNAAVVDPTKPFSQLSNFGNNFLLRFECALLPCVVLNGVTLIDTPGVLSGNKQTSRGYDFEGVIQWFAERVDLILLIFDAHKLDISDEFRRCINALRGNDTKIRIILNKADMVSYQQLMRVYGALMWSLGKVIPSPEVARVYIGSFWNHPLQNDENRKLFEAEANDLYADIARLPRDAAIRKINDFIKRARLAKGHDEAHGRKTNVEHRKSASNRSFNFVLCNGDGVAMSGGMQQPSIPAIQLTRLRGNMRDCSTSSRQGGCLKHGCTRRDTVIVAVHSKVHAYLLATLRKQIPMWGKDAKKKQLISQLQQVYQQVAADHAISLGDFPPLSLMQEKLAAFDWNKIPKLDPKRIEALDAMIKQQIPQLMALIPAEEAQAAMQTADGSVVETKASPFLSLKHQGAGPAWLLDKFLNQPLDVERYRTDFELIGPDNTGRINGTQAKAELVKSKLPSAVLHRVWNLADITRDGYLDLYEYSLARHFIEMKLEGFELPANLPDALMPPCHQAALGASRNEVSDNGMHPDSWSPGSSSAALGEDNPMWSDYGVAGSGSDAAGAMRLGGSSSPTGGGGGAAAAPGGLVSSSTGAHSSSLQTTFM